MHNNSTILPEVCESAKYLAENVWFRAILYFRLFMALTGLIFCILLFRVLSSHLAFHPNVKILWINHNIWATLESMSNVILQSYYLSYYLSKQGDPCQRLFSANTVFFIRGPTKLCLYGLIWSLAAMAIERIFATIYYRTYETINGLFGICLSVTQVRFLLTSTSVKSPKGHCSKTRIHRKMRSIHFAFSTIILNPGDDKVCKSTPYGAL